MKRDRLLFISTSIFDKDWFILLSELRPSVLAEVIFGLPFLLISRWNCFFNGGRFRNGAFCAVRRRRMGRKILMRKLGQPFRFLGDYFYHKAIPFLSPSFVKDALRIITAARGEVAFIILSLDTPKIHNLR